MNNKAKFLQAIKSLINRKKKYKKIHAVDELLDLPNQILPNYKKIHNVDLSELDLSNYGNMLSGKIPKQFMTPQEMAAKGIITSWTDNVIWPTLNKLPDNINPEKILSESKQSSEIKELHDIGKTGKGINIAIIDQRLNLNHKEYTNNIKSYMVFGPWNKNGIDYHGSLVAGIAVGKTTGVAPDANLYYYAAPVSEITPDNKRVLSRKYAIEAIKEIIKFNETHSDNEKIRFLSCSWGTRDDLHTKECEELFKICEQNGIKIIGAAYKHMGTSPMDKRYENTTENIGIPTDGKTTSFWQGGYCYTRQGGSSSTFPYIAGVFACACQGNQIFFTRPHWQEELTTILQDTAILTENGGKIINPIGICEKVSQIAHEMEINLIKQKSLENE